MNWGCMLVDKIGKCFAEVSAGGRDMCLMANKFSGSAGRDRQCSWHHHHGPCKAVIVARRRHGRCLVIGVLHAPTHDLYGVASRIGLRTSDGQDRASSCLEAENFSHRATTTSSTAG